MKYRIWVAIALAAFGWGSGSVANRAALVQGADAHTLIALRLAIAAILLFAYLWLSGRGLTRRPLIWWRGGLLGVVGMGAPMTLFTHALKHISVGLSGLIMTSAAIVTVGWAHLLLDGERLVPRVVGGMLVGMSGVATLLLAGETGIIGGGNLLRGVSLVLAGAIATGFTSALSRKYMLHHSVLDFAGPQFAFGAVVGLLAWPLLGDMDLGGMTVQVWLLLAYLGLVGTTVPFLAFLWASQLSSATRVAVVSYIVPIFSLVGGIVFLDERLSWFMALGGALIVGGVIIVDRIEASR